MLLATQTGTSSVALDLIVRQAAFLALLAAIGSGPASLLSARFDLATRLALAPALGLCVAVCVTTALLGFAPVEDTWWVVVALAAASLVCAGWRWRRGRVERGRFGRREIAQLLLVLAVVAAPIDYTLHQHYSVGPSVYLVRDVLGYTAETDAEQHLSVHAAAKLNGKPLANLEDELWASYASGFQNMDATPVEASANDLLGLHATDTIASYMLVLIMVGALGAFAAVRFTLASRSWAAALAGVLFGGPFYMQLFFDGSQAAIAGTTLMLPFALLGWEAIRGGRRTDLVLLGLIGATLLAVYPLFAPALVGAGGLVVLWLAWRAYRHGRLRAGIRVAVPRLALVLALAAAFSSVAFARDLRYWQAILAHTQSLPVLGYQFTPAILPTWLLQTGEFANLPNFVTDPTTSSILRGAVIPALLLVLILYGLARRRVGLALAGLILLAAGLAEYAYSSNNGCEYCIDRNLLPIEPATIALLALGVGALAAAATASARVLALGCSLLVLVPTGFATRSSRERFSNYDWFLDAADRTLAARLPRHAGAIELEGFNEDISGPSEFAGVYDMLTERGFTVSVALEGNEFESDAYLVSPRPPGPEFDPGYRYVLTRLSSVATDRTVVARSGGLALERRTAALDVTPYSGLALPLQRVDPDGLVWAQPQFTPFRMYVVGGHGRAPVYVRVTLHTDIALGVTAGIQSSSHDGTIVACVPTTGTAPIRSAVLYMSGTLNPPPVAPAGYPMPNEDIQLTGLRAVTGHCRP